ncbi:MAG: hypothetical protein PUB39_03810 [Eubacteriales bacterium]|nr:hypothetical protein [Eubacteriales bacterium]
MKEFEKRKKAKLQETAFCVALTFFILFIPILIMKIRDSNMPAEALLSALMWSLPVTAFVAIICWASISSKEKQTRKDSVEAGLAPGEEPDPNDPAWFVTDDYPPTVLHISMFDKRYPVVWKKEGMDASWSDTSVPYELYSIRFVKPSGEQRVVFLPSEDAVYSTDPGAMAHFRKFCKAWGLKLASGRDAETLRPYNGVKRK